MPITGNLETMNLAELLQWLANNRQTGTLIVSDGEAEKRIYVKDGSILSSSSSDPKRFLGHFLVSKGVITEEILAQAISVQEQQGKLLGEILVEGGATDHETLAEMLRLNAEENICDLFAWEHGNFEFIDDELPNHELVPMSTNITGLIMEGMRRIDHAAAMKSMIPSPQCVPVSVAPLIDADEMDPGWQGVLEAVDDDRSIEDICLHTHSSEFFVCDVLFRKANEGKVKFVRPRVIAPESDHEPTAVPESRSENSDSSAEDPTTLEGLMAGAAAHIKDESFDSAARLLQRATSLKPTESDHRKHIARMELEIRAGIAEIGVDPGSVPVLETSLNDLTAMSFSPEEGFILSRINGSSDIGSIMKISPLRELESLVVFWRLTRDGHIQFQGSD